MITRAIDIFIPYIAPYDWDHQLAFLKRHEIVGVEKIDLEAYERIVSGGGSIRVTNDCLRSGLNVSYVPGQMSAEKIATRVGQMFDVKLDPSTMHAHLGRNRRLKKLIETYPGVRLPVAFDPFEAIMTTILGQLVSVTAARALTESLVRELGRETLNPRSGDRMFEFPSPEAIASSPLDFLKTTRVRKETLRTVAKLVQAEELRFGDVSQLKSTLLNIRGIGPWTAEYVSIRALGHADSFPGSDLILKRVLETYAEVTLAKLQPWSAYAAIYLWRGYAEKFSGRTWANRSKGVRR